MASFPELGRALVDLTGTPYPTTDLVARKLRSAGLISVKGVNRYAGAQMTSRDAATLLLALLIDRDRGGDVVQEVTKVMNLPVVGASATTAVDAIESVIDDAASYRGEISVAIDMAGSCVMVQYAHPEEVGGTTALVCGAVVKRHCARWVNLNDSVFRELHKILND